MLFLLLAGVCSAFIASTSSPTAHDSVDKISEAATFSEGEDEPKELENFVVSLKRSDSSDFSLVIKMHVHSEDLSVQVLSKGQYSEVSKPSVAVTDAPCPVAVTDVPRPVVVTDAPNLCENLPIDTFLMIKDGSTYVFKGDFYWKIHNNNILSWYYPRIITEDWDNLPGYIDASFTWSSGETFFFKGKWYWKFVNKEMDPDSPKLISEGFPGIPDYLDAAVVLHGDGKAYFFKGNQYWQYDRYTGTSSRYPKIITSDWNGIPSYLDAALLWHNNRTYLFKDGIYYRIIDNSLAVDPQVFDNFGKRYPLPIGPEWFGC